MKDFILFALTVVNLVTIKGVRIKLQTRKRCKAVAWEIRSKEMAE
jgi:hypothetical protein